MFRRSAVSAFAVCLLISTGSQGAVVFSDNFKGSAKPDWGKEVGNLARRPASV
jgi:hypothetical protein